MVTVSACCTEKKKDRQIGK